MPDDTDRPETPAEAEPVGNLLLWFTGSLLVFGLFLVVVPGSEPAGRTWLWVGVVLVVLGGATSALAVRARLRHLRAHR